MDEYMEYSLGVSNYTNMACSSDQIVGFLFGRIDGLKEEVPHKSLLGELPSMARSFFEYESLNLHELAFMWTLFLTEVKLLLRMPKSDASIEMFIVGSRYRGTGIGTELVNRFLRTAKESGARLVTLYTDDRMSNWQFYERRGFKRVGTFYDNITSHYSGQDSMGIIYAMDLSEVKG
jgi:ribosomal protein S18 acetylase RimI-like enzyme